MNGRLQGFLDFLDLLAEGQRRQAEVVTGRSFEAPAALAPVQAGNVVEFPSKGHLESKETAMNAYSNVRNTGFAAVIVAAIAGVVGNALAIDQRFIYERDLPQAAAAAALPEVVVTASRLEQ